MSMATQRGDKGCDLCGRQFESDEALAGHLAAEHGGLDGNDPGGTGRAVPDAGSGPTGTTTSGSRPRTDDARDSEDAGGTTEQTDGGAGRVQTE
jgi:hypothetical protein